MISSIIVCVTSSLAQHRDITFHLEVLPDGDGSELYAAIIAHTHESEESDILNDHNGDLSSTDPLELYNNELFRAFVYVEKVKRLAGVAPDSLFIR